MNMVRSVEEDIQVVQTPSSYMFGDEFITWFTFVSTNFDDMNDKIIMRRKFWNLRNMAWHLCKSNPSPKLPITIDLLPEFLLLQMLRIAKHARKTSNKHLLAKLEYRVFEWDCFRRSGLINDSFGEIVCNSMPTEILSANLNIIPHSMFTMSFIRDSRSSKYFIILMHTLNNLNAKKWFKKSIIYVDFFINPRHLCGSIVCIHDITLY